MDGLLFAKPNEYWSQHGAHLVEVSQKEVDWQMDVLHEPFLVIFLAIYIFHWDSDGHLNVNDQKMARNGCKTAICHSTSFWDTLYVVLFLLEMSFYVSSSYYYMTSKTLVSVKLTSWSNILYISQKW